MNKSQEKENANLTQLQVLAPPPGSLTLSNRWEPNLPQPEADLVSEAQEVCQRLLTAK